MKLNFLWVISHLNFFSCKWPMASFGPVLNYSFVKSFNLVCHWFSPLLWDYISNFIIEIVGGNESSFKEIQFIAKLWKHIPVLTLKEVPFSDTADRDFYHQIETAYFFLCHNICVFQLVEGKGKFLFHSLGDGCFLGSFFFF